MLMGSLVNNAETMINVTKKDEKELEKPDVLLQEKLLPSDGKAARAFRYLELEVIPVKYVIMQKRLKFLKYILDENSETMLSQVYKEQKKDSRKGDFVHQVKI